MPKVSSQLAARVKQAREFNAEACFHCGTCTALCPMGYDILPRMLFRDVMLGREDRMEEHTDKIFSCLLCRMCEVNCPADVHIAGNIRFLRNYINKEQYHLV